MGTVTLTHDCDINRLDDPWAIDGPIRDTYLQEEAPDAAQGDNNIECFAHVIASGKDTDEWKSVHFYDLNYFLPAGAAITAAVWHIYVTFTDMAADQNIRAWRTTRASAGGQWTEAGATWNKYDGVNNWGLNHDRASPYIVLGYISSTGWHNFDLKALVDDAWDNRSGLLAFLTCRFDEHMGDDGGINYRARFWNPGSLTYCHKLRITYTLAGRTFQVVLR